MATQVTHNNDGRFYTIDVDLAKEGAEVFDLTTYFKARVADNKVGLRFRWFWQGQVFNTVGKKPRVVGLVGQYSFKKADDGTNQELVMSPDASAVAFTGDVNDCEPGGYATYYFPEQMFPQDGMFKGTVGLLDDSGEAARYTSVDIWFKVYPQAGGAQMGRACDFYISDLDTALANAKEKMRQQSENFDVALKNALQDLREKYQAQVKKNEDMSDETRAALSKLADAVGAIQAQIDAGNVVTLIQHNADIKRTSEMIENKLAQMSLIPETFENSDAIKKAYPNGKTGIMVAVDTGHKWIWFNGQWNDCGAYQSAGYPEVTEARVGADQLGAKKYESLSEAFHRQIAGLVNLGNQAFSYQVTGTVGQQVSLQSEWEAGIKAGATLQVKFDLTNDSDLSVIQVYANGKWFASIKRQDFGTWQGFKLDKDIGTLGLVIPDDKFSKGFSAEISFKVITAPVADVRSELNPLMSYEFSVSPSTSQDELQPNAISNIDLDKGSKIYIRLKSDANDDVITGYQLTANGQFLQSFNDLNVWHEVTLTDETTSLGFQAFKESVNQDFDGTFQILGETLGAVYGKFKRNSSKLLTLSLPISATAGVDNINQIAVNNLDIPKGSKIRVRFSTACDPDLLEGYQLWANNRYLTSYNNANWHEITLPSDTTSLGYAFYGTRVHGDVTGNLEILGESFNDLYSLFDIEEQSKNELNSSLIEKLKQKENQINTITNGITHGVNFVFMTDPHFPTNDLLSKPMMKHVLEHTSAPFVLCGGDFPGAYGTKDDVLDSVKEVIDYQNSIGKDRFFSIQANHDFTIRKSPTENTGWTASNALVYDTLIRPNEAYLPSIQAGKEYYYIDILAQKTRIFMLNSMDGNPLAENTNAWGTQYTISQDQADWLVAKAKEKDGWKFIFVCHVPCDSNLDSYHPNEEFFHQVAAAINNKHQLNFHSEKLNEDADFTGTSSQVVTILAGHNHMDQSSFKDGVLSITTTSDARYSDGGWARKPQSYTSPAFDVVSIDYDKGTINTTRIGGGQDRVFSYAAPNQGEEINYLHLKPVADLAVNGTAKCVVDMATPAVPEATEWSNNCFKWSSSDPTVAEVDASGVITAHASGTVTITVATRDGQHSDRCNVTVK